jgi:hypothetical protein
MNYSPMLAPVVALIAWSMIMWLWLYATRLPAMRRAGIDLKGRVGGRGQNLDGILDDRIQWKSHNYNHLMEQPTLFYAVAIALAMMSVDRGPVLWLAWGYVALRVVHSLIQATVNVVKWRGRVFGLSSLLLLAMTLTALAGFLR